MITSKEELNFLTAFKSQVTGLSRVKSQTISTAEQCSVLIRELCGTVPIVVLVLKQTNTTNTGGAEGHGV